jgi:putative FmdB family regulatory protein
MPTYEYECTKCGKVFELFHSITEPARKKLKKDDPKPCKCNAPITRLIGTGGGVIFKGSGFYETDYRSESYNKAAKAEKEAATGKKDTKSDNKKTSDNKTSDNKTESKPKETKKSPPKKSEPRP